MRSAMPCCAVGLQFGLQADDPDRTADVRLPRQADIREGTPDAAEHELECWKNLPVCYRTHATHVGRRQVAATKKLASGQKAAQTRKRRAAGRDAAVTRKPPATAAKPAATRKKRDNLTAAT